MTYRLFYNNRSVLFWLTVLCLGLVATRPAGAQVDFTLNGTPAASFCDRAYLTNRFLNKGAVASGLVITNQLPNNRYVYVTNLTVITVPGQVWTNAAAEPLVVNGTNLIWSFPGLVGTGVVDHVLITEVFYYPTNLPKESYEWVELFNPTTNTIGMTNWSLRDVRPGLVDVIPTLDLAPNEFIIVAASTNAFLETHAGYTGRVFEVADGAIGSGLDIFADGVFLRNGATQNVDQMSYGGSTAGFNPACPTVAATHSLERYPANQDTGAASDWRDQVAPNPGSGTLQYGLGSGEAVQVVYAVEISCGVNNAPVIARAAYEQPSGTPRSATASHTVTIEEGALVISKTPGLQTAGYSDLVSWNITVSNQGFGKAVNVRISDSLGNGLKFDGFSVDPTNGSPSSLPLYGGQVAWDASVIPALTSLAPNTAVSIVVTAEMVACTELYNRADATWGCQDLLAVSNQTCADTAVEGQTAGASIFVLDRHPNIQASLSPAGPILVDYCSGTPITLTVTNIAGAEVGWARLFTYTPNLPPGFHVTPTNSTGQVVIGDLAPGQGTNVVVTLYVDDSGGCPIAMNEKAIIFLADYQDGCEHPFSTPPLVTTARVINPPGATVVKQMATSFSGDAGVNPVSILFTYSNFNNTAITIRDTYPAHTNLSVANITADGVTNAGAVVWNNTLSGSGVFTASYAIVAGVPCGGPWGLQVTTLKAENVNNCRGCETEVIGSDQIYYTRLTPGSGCFSDGTNGTNGCYFFSSKTGPGGAVELCSPGTLSHTFYGFTGTNLQTNWNGVSFNSDLAGGRGYLDNTQSVAVWIDNSNVTAQVSITQTNPNLVIDFSNLNTSVFSRPGLVTNSLVVSWDVAITGTAQVVDASSLLLPNSGCAAYTEYAFWNGGSGKLAIEMPQCPFAEACGLIHKGIRLTNLPSPGTIGLSNSLFPTYDTRVVFNLDADGDQAASLTYVANSTTFSNMYAIGGGALTGAEPVVTATNITWELGDLASNGAGAICFWLRAPCETDPDEKHSALVAYNSRCARGTEPPDEAVYSGTNPISLLFQSELSCKIKPEVVFINSSNLSFTVSFLNAGAATAYNFQSELLLPSNIVYQGAAVTAAVVTASNVIWTFQFTNAIGSLTNADDDIYYDDLPPGGTVTFGVTCAVVNCDTTVFALRGTCGCNGQDCQTSAVAYGSFEGIAGGLITRTEFPDTGSLCQASTVAIRVRNSGQAMNYNVRVFQTLPFGITYVADSAQYIHNGVTNSAAPDATTPRIVWSASNIPPFVALSNEDTVILRYQVHIGAQAAGGVNTFVAQGEYRDICRNLVTNREASTLMLPNEPLLNLTKSARLLTPGPQTNFTSASVAPDPGDTLVYRLSVAHDPASDAPVYAMKLSDTLPAVFSYLSASPPPDMIDGQTLVWSNSTIMSLIGGSPYAVDGEPFSIYITGTVATCISSAANVAILEYGCDAENLDLSTEARHTLRAAPSITFPVGQLELYTCGGSFGFSVTNLGNTASGLLLTNTAPSGYIFLDSASITGAFNSPLVHLTLGGSPSGSVAVLDLTSTNICGPLNDPLGAPITDPTLTYKAGFAVNFGLINSGSNLDFVANPLDHSYEDPDPPPRGIQAASSQLRYEDPCASVYAVTNSRTDLPDHPDPDIELRPFSVVPTNNEIVTFTCTIRNRGESGDAENLHIRLRFGVSWTNLTLVSSNVLSRPYGTSNLTVELQGSSNVLVDLPGVILDPLQDRVQLVFTAQATQSGNQDLRVLAEVVGECLEAGIVPTQAYTNTLGEAPLANSITGSVIPAVNGVYYAFDQDMTFGAGYSLSKTVRYQGEDESAADASRTARIGEELVYRIEAQYFGAVFSNILVSDSLPTGLVWRAPVDAGSSDALTNWSYDAGSGVFTLPTPLNSNAFFKVDMPVALSNDWVNQNGYAITNVAASTFNVFGVTNAVAPATAMVYVLEPDLRLTKLVNSNYAQAGNIVTFSNLIQHADGTSTAAYDVVFSDTLPAGLVLVDPGSDGLDNDGNGLVDGADTGEAALAVTPTFFSVSSNKNATLGAMSTGVTVAVMYKARVEASVIVGSTVTNQANISYASLTAGDCTNGNRRTGADGLVGLNDYYRTSSVPLNITAVRAVSKTFISSSQTNTPDAPTNVFTIGERVIYRIRVDIPNGTISNLVLTEIMPSGMDWVGLNTNAGLTYPGTGFSISVPTPSISMPFTTNQGLVISDPDPTPASSIVNDGTGRNIVFRFPSITNQPDGDAGNDYFDLSLELVLANTNLNVGYYPGVTTNANRVSVSNSYVTLGATSQIYTVAEPRVTLAKQMSPTNFDAGDTVSISISITNSSAARANAYNLRVMDFLTNAVFDTGTVVLLETAAGWGFSNAPATGGLNLYWFTTNDTALPANAAATNRFSVKIAQAVAPGRVYTNRAVLLNSDTLYGVIPGGIPTRTQTATNAVTGRVPPITITKSLYATSETNAPPDSATNNLQIGETVTYAIKVTLPESTITNLLVTDLLPAGLAYIHDSVRLDTNGLGGWLAPQIVFPTGTALLATSGQPVSNLFAGLSVITNDNLPDNNSFTIYLDAMTLNTNSNCGTNTQTVLTNSARATFTGNPLAASTSALVVARVVEPQVTLTKTLAPKTGDAGDLISVTLKLTNSGNAAAYNLDLCDALTLPCFDPVGVTSTVAPTGFVFVLSNSAVYIRSDTNAPLGTNTLEPGEALVFSFQAPLATNLAPNLTLTNTATIAWTSLKATNLYDVQRTGGATGLDTLVSSNFLLAKALAGTSQQHYPADTSGSNVTIGEYATFRLSVSVPEGTVTNLAVTDSIPTGMAYIAGSVSVDTNGFAGSLPGAPVVSGGGSGLPVTFTFNGLTVVSNDNIGANNTFQLSLNAMLLDVPNNVGLPPQTILTNRATVGYAGLPHAVTSGVVVLTVVEPNLAIAKQMTGPSNGLVTLALTVTNSGQSSAFDLHLSDRLPSNVFQTASIAPVSIPTGFTYAVSGAPGDATVTLKSDTNAIAPTNCVLVGQSLAFTFSALLVSNPPPVFTNVATILTNTTIDGPSAGERFEPQRGATNVLRLPSFILTKTITTPASARPLNVGETVVFRLTVTNTGSLGLNPVRLEDNWDANFLTYVSAVPAPNTLGASTLTWTNIGLLATNRATNVLVTFTARASTLTGWATNLAVATITATNGATLPPQTNAASLQIIDPSIHLVKLAGDAPDDGIKYAVANQAIIYTYIFTNTGDTTLTNLTVTDNRLGTVGTLTNYLAPGAVGTLSITASVPASVTNLGTVTGLPAATNGTILGSPAVTATNDAIVQVVSPAISLVKTAGNAAEGQVEYITPGSNVVYTYRVINSGSTWLTNIVVTDSVLTAWTGRVAGVMAPGATNWLFATNFNVTANVTNLGVAVGTPAFSSDVVIPGITNVSASNNAVVQVVSPGIRLVKTAGEAADGAIKYATPHSNVVYTYSVINSGDTWLTNIVVSDSVLTAWTGRVAGVMAPGTTNRLYATNFDVTANVTNLGVAVGSPAFSSGVLIPDITNVIAQDDAVVEVVDPRIELIKTAADALEGAVKPVLTGSNVVYAYRVVNSGNTWLTNIVVTDNIIGSIGTVPGPVAPGATNWLLATNLNVTANVTNLGYASGIPAFSNGIPIPGVPSVTDTNAAVVRVVWPGLGLTKTAVIPSNRPAMPGEWLTFRVVAANTGDVTFIAISMEDRFDTNDLAFVSATPAHDSVSNGVIAWTNVGALDIGASTNILVRFTALRAVSDWHTNTVAAQPSPPVDFPPAPGATSDAPYLIDAPATVGDYVWYDINLNGIQDDGEPGLGGVTVRLYATNAVDVIDAAVTDSAGHYLFTNVVPTNYLIGFSLLPGYAFSPPRMGGDPTKNSAADQVTGRSPVFTLAPGATNLMLDAGMSDHWPFIKLIKTADSTPEGDIDYIPAGADVLYTYHLTNTGTTHLVNITLNDNRLGPIGPISNVLAPGASLALTATGLNISASVTNVAEVMADPADYYGVVMPGVPQTGDTNDAVVIVTLPDYVLHKQLVSPTNRPALTNETVSFLISVTNTGVLPLHRLRLDDSYATNILSFASAVPSNDALDLVAGQVTWSNLGPVCVGCVTTVVVNFTALEPTWPLDTTNLVVSVAGLTNGTPADYPRTSQAPVVVVAPGYLIEKTLLIPTNGLTPVGQPIVFRITITNTGDTLFDSVRLDDQYPSAHLAFVGAQPSNNSLDALAGQIAWSNLGSLAVGGIIVVTTDFRAVSGTLPGAATNLAVVSPATTNDLPLPPQTNAAPVSIGSAGLRLIKLAGTAPEGKVEYVATNATVSYVFIVTNVGDTFLNDIVVTDNKLGLIGTITNPLAPASATTLYASVAVPASVTNVAVAIAQPADDGGVPLPDFPTVADTNDAIVRLVWPGIRLVKTAGDASQGEVLYAFAGQNVIYHYRIVNTGSTWLGPITLNDDKLGLVGVVAGPLAPGAETTLHATNRNLLADVINVAKVIGNPTDETGRDLPVFSDVTDSAEAQVRLSASFVVAKEDFPDPVRPGEALSYTIWVANPSPNPIYNVTVTETWPEAFEYIGASPQPTAGNKVWALGTLAPGKVQAIVVYGRIAVGAAPGVINNRVVVTSSNAGTNIVNEPGVINPLPGPETAEISVTKRDLADPVRPGGSLTYIIHVENSGPAAASNLVVRESYDPLFNFQSAVPAPDPGSTAVWSLGTLAAGRSLEITIVGQVSTQATDGTLLLNRVTAIAANSPTSADSEITIVDPYPPLAISKTASSDQILAGVSFSYTILITNTSATVAVSNVRVVDHYDPAFVFESSVPAPLVGTDNVWRFDSLAPGASAVIVITGHTTTNLKNGYVIFNTVEVVSDSGSATAHEPATIILPASLGDTFWEDFNLNGLYDDPVSEHVVGRRVGLFDESGVLIAVTNVDAEGHYRFTTLWPGTYVVGFDLPPLHRFVIPNVGANRAIDSDVDRATWRTPPITLAPGQNDMTWDAGCIEVGIIGDTVWVDVNRNGLHDENLEHWGLNGIPVHLFRLEGDGTLGGSTATLVGTTVTSYGSGREQGSYQFAYVDYGDYLVAVDLSYVPETLTEQTTLIVYNVSIGYDTAYYAADFGFIYSLIPVVLRYFNAEPTQGGILLTWETAAEIENLGFNIYRAERPDGDKIKPNASLIPGMGTSEGQRYQWLDSGASLAKRWLYWLEDVSWNFKTSLYGPITVHGVAGDYDGDGKADIVMYQESSGVWVVFRSASGYADVTFGLGGPGWEPVPGDYDGDGLMDPAVYQESSGMWRILLSGKGYAETSLILGGPGNRAVALDYDGDRRTDPAVYQEASGAWQVMLSAAGYEKVTLVFGGAGYAAVPGDYDGDGKADVALYQEASGTWGVLLSSRHYEIVTALLGGPGHVPVPGDYDGDGRTDPGVYQENTGQWQLMLSSRDYKVMGMTLGGAGCQPMPCDYDGDGRQDLVVYHAVSGRLQAMLSSDNYAIVSVLWGNPSYRPVY